VAKSNDSSIIEIIDLHPQEMALLKVLRYHCRFGNVTIKVRDGLPFRVEKAIEPIDLTIPQPNLT
jgi:hypothetical protein